MLHLQFDITLGFTAAGREPALHLQFNIPIGFTAAGENFIILQKGQWFGGVTDFTLQQPGAARAAETFPTLVLNANLMGFQRVQQRRVLLLALKLRTGSTQQDE